MLNECIRRASCYVNVFSSQATCELVRKISQTYTLMDAVYVPVLNVKYHEKGIAKALGELRGGADHCWHGRARKTSSK